MSKPSPQVEMARVALLFITSPASAIAVAAIAALLLGFSANWSEWRVSPFPPVFTSDGTDTTDPFVDVVVVVEEHDMA